MAVDVSALSVRRVYLVDSRNLQWAAYCGSGLFIGIREKFDVRFLSTEGSTVYSVGAELGVISDSIRLTETVGGTYCELCGTLAVWEPDEPGARRGTWLCESGCQDGPDGVLPMRIPNRPLFRALDRMAESMGVPRTCEF